jgi:uncharacterized membrane protein
VKTSKAGPGARWLARHWLLVMNLAMGLFIGGTALPPVLMRMGLEAPARAVYLLYGLNCHQLPQRSYFLFGPSGVNTYSRDQVTAWGADPARLRGFVGNSEVGFKLGMAQRNTAIYGTFLLAGVVYSVVRGRVRGLSLAAFALLAVPMLVDGVSHIVSEVGGSGFRETNVWLEALTGGAFRSTFYAGTTVGSFNWLMRTLTGALFAVGCVWYVYPRIEQGLEVTRRQSAAGPGRPGLASTMVSPGGQLGPGGPSRPSQFSSARKHVRAGL